MEEFKTEDYDTLGGYLADLTNRYTEIIEELKRKYRNDEFDFSELPEPGGIENTTNFLKTLGKDIKDPDKLDKAYGEWTQTAARYKKLQSRVEEEAEDIDVAGMALVPIVAEYINFLETHRNLRNTVQERFGLDLTDIKLHEDSEKGEITIEQLADMW